MKILVLGGTQFIGRHVVQELLTQGHAVTLLNRGVTAPELFPDLRTIRVDRETDEFFARPELKETWDAVVDLSVYFPKTLSRFLKTLHGNAGRYLMCSTLSAYVASAMDGPTAIVHRGRGHRYFDVELWPAQGGV